MSPLALVLASLSAVLFTASLSNASGLDVQLKDIKRSFYYFKEAPEQCRKLTFVEVREFGSLTHCHPEDDHVECPVKSGKTLVAYEEKAACDAAARPATGPASKPASGTSAPPPAANQ